MQGINVRQIFNRFGGNYLNQTTANESRLITLPNINRTGMEFNGVYLVKQIKAVVVWGSIESLFLSTLSDELIEERIKEILNLKPPLIILSKSFKHVNILLEINLRSQTNIPIILTNFSTSEIAFTIHPWLSRRLANWETVHGTALSIFGEGVLLIGSSGVGKSEIAMELINKNHLFIGDDAIDITQIGNTIIAKSNEITKNFIEIRGLGILNLKEMYGIQKIIDTTTISAVIYLKTLSEFEDEDLEIERIGRGQKFYMLKDVKIPLYVIPISMGRKMSEIIESSVIDLKLKKSGYISAEMFEKNRKEITTK